MPSVLGRYSLQFIEASDDGLFEDDVYAARLDKEAAAVKVCPVCATTQLQLSHSNGTTTPTSLLV